MEAERAAQLKKVIPQLLWGFIGVESVALPIFRSGGRINLNFWQWLVNHSTFGPAVEYVPVEDYARELQGVFPWYPVQAEALNFTTTEEAMKRLNCGESAVQEFVRKGWVSIVAGDEQLHQYGDLMADVRRDGLHHSARSLVQPDDPEVRAVARELVKAPDFVKAAQEFVNSFTLYSLEVGDYWRIPGETLTNFERYYDELNSVGSAQLPECDCDDSSILLCSILRNYVPADQVFCAFGLWNLNGRTEGHMWVVTEGEDGEDLVLEATAAPKDKLKGKYFLYGMFNDVYTFSTDAGLKEFDLRTVPLVETGIRR